MCNHLLQCEKFTKYFFFIHMNKEWEEGDSGYIFSQVPAPANWLRQTEVKEGRRW